MSGFFDQYLLFRLRTKRDKDAFAKLYDRYVTSIYRFVFLKLPSKEMAEDVASETFLRCWQLIQQNKEIRNFRALLYQIARNLVADTYRKGKNSGIPMPLVTFESVETSSSIEMELSDQERGRRMIEARADVALVLKKISRLKEDYQDVLALRLIDGLSFADIAEVLEKSAGNIRVIYHRAMKALETINDHE